MLRGRCSGVATTTAAMVVAVVSSSSSAHAEVTVEGSLYGATSYVLSDRVMHNDADETPDVLANRDVRLRGAGLISGFGVQGAVVVDHKLRIGLDEALLVSASGLTAEAQGLPSGVTTDHTRLFGYRFALFLGRQFGDPDATVRPYVDLSLGVSLIDATLGLRSDDRGHWGQTSYALWAPYVAPRAGAHVMLGAHGFVDVSACYSLFGVEKATFVAGLGVSVP